MHEAVYYQRSSRDFNRVHICCSEADAGQTSLMGYGAASALQMDSKTGAKTKRAIAAKKRRRRHRRNAITHAKSPKSNIVPKVSSFVQLNDKSNASINAKSTVAAKTETPQPTQPDSTSPTSLNANSTAAAKTETAQSSQPDDKLDPVIKKAMPTIAAKMENSVSVELVEMKRAEKNASGKSIDTQTLERGRFYISSKKTRRTSAGTIWLPRRTTTCAVSEKRKHMVSRLRAFLPGLRRVRSSFK